MNIAKGVRIVFAVVALTSVGECLAAAEFSASLENAMSPQLVGEPLRFDITFKNLLATPIKVPDLGSGLAAGNIQITIFDPNGKRLPGLPLSLPEYLQRVEMIDLKPGESRSWKGLSSILTNARTKVAGKYVIRLTVATGTEPVLAVATIEQIDVPDNAIQTVFTASVPSLGDHAETSVATLEVVDLQGERWLFYRRRVNGKTNRVARVAAVASSTEDRELKVKSSSDDPVLEATFLDPNRQPRALRIDSRDGTIFPSPDAK